MGVLHRGSATALALLLGAAGCSRANPRFGDGAASGGSGGQGDGTRTGGGETATTDGGDGSGGSGTRPDVPSDTTGAAVCGNGVLEPGEECDEAGDGCRLDCHRAGAVVWTATYAPEPSSDHHFNGVALLGPDVVAVGQAASGGSRTTAIVRFKADAGELRDATMFTASSETDGEVLAVQAVDSVLYLGASFLQPSGDGFDAVAASLWADPKTGILSQQWSTPVLGGVARAIKFHDDLVYAAVGRFTIAGYGLATVDPASGAPDFSSWWLSSDIPNSGQFDALLIRGGTLLVGGTIQGAAVVGEVSATEADFSPWLILPGNAPGTNRLQAMAEVSGDVIVAGWQENTEMDRDAWIGRYDDNGDAVWAVTIDGGSADADEIEAIALDDHGDIIAVGGLGEPTLATITALDADDGTQLWQRSYDLDGGETFLRGVVVDKDIFVVGEHFVPGAMVPEAIAMRLRP